MEVVYGIIAIGIVIFVLILGIAIGITSEQAKCYHEITKSVKMMNDYMPKFMEMYDKMMNMYQE